MVEKYKWWKSTASVKTLAKCRGISQSADTIRKVPLSSQETEMFVDPDHPSKVLEGLNRLRLNRTLCDVILCCEEQEFPCHRYVLASFTSYFEVNTHIY